MVASKKKKRGLEEISHLFLSRQRILEKEEGPGENETGTSGDKVPLLIDQTVRDTSPVGHNLAIVFSSSSSLFAEKSFLACNLAVELAKRGSSVALIETTIRVPNTFYLLGPLFSPDATEPLRPINIFDNDRKCIKAFFWEQGLDDVDSFAIISELSRESEFVIINALPEISLLREMLCSLNSLFIVPTTARSEQLLNSYRLIKKISQQMTCEEVALLVIDEGFSLNPDAAFGLLKDMAHKFLECEVQFWGSIPKGPEFFRSIFRRTPLLLENHTSPISKALGNLADLIVKKAHLNETDLPWQKQLLKQTQQK